MQVLITCYLNSIAVITPMFFKEDTNPYFRSCFTDKVAHKLKNLILVHRQNLFHGQEHQKCAYHRSMKP